MPSSVTCVTSVTSVALPTFAFLSLNAFNPQIGTFEKYSICLLHIIIPPHPFTHDELQARRDVSLFNWGGGVGLVGDNFQPTNNMRPLTSFVLALQEGAKFLQ